MKLPRDGEVAVVVEATSVKLVAGGATFVRVGVKPIAKALLEPARTELVARRGPLDVFVRLYKEFVAVGATLIVVNPTIEEFVTGRKIVLVVERRRSELVAVSEVFAIVEATGREFIADEAVVVVDELWRKELDEAVYVVDESAFR